MASIFFQSAKLNSSTGCTIWMPALLMRMSMPPKAFAPSSTEALTWSSFVTSTPTPMACAPVAFSSAAVASAASLLRSAMMIFAPSCANRMAISLPMPLAEPVM
ncbi:hypothetical protein D3C71_1014210 [compost metagenome]